MHTALWLLVGGYVYKLLPNTTTPRSRLYSLTHTHWYLWMSADFYQIQFHSRSFPPLLDNQHPVTMVIELSPEPYKYEGSRRWFLILGRVELNQMSLMFVSTNLLYLLFYFFYVYIYICQAFKKKRVVCKFYTTSFKISQFNIWIKLGIGWKLKYKAFLDLCVPSTKLEDTWN